MFFRDEYEHVGSDGLIYLFEVEGVKHCDEEGSFTEIVSLSIADESGNAIDTDHDMYEALKEEAFERDYELEHHGTSFDYYDGVLS